MGLLDSRSTIHVTEVLVENVKHGKGNINKYSTVITVNMQSAFNLVNWNLNSDNSKHGFFHCPIHQEEKFLVDSREGASNGKRASKTECN